MNESENLKMTWELLDASEQAVKSIGVIYAPFQTASLIEAHKEVINYALEHHSRVVIALPVSPISPSKNNPLDFETRRDMIFNDVPILSTVQNDRLVQHPRHIVVVPVKVKKYPEDQVVEFENAVSAANSVNLFAPVISDDSPTQVFVYADDDFLSLYNDNGGKWETLYYDFNSLPFTLPSHDFLNQEAQARQSMAVLPAVSSKPESTQEAYRRGMICGLNAQFPINWPTVDMAIWRKHPVSHKIQYLFGKKPGEKGWRFPGGFKDRLDVSFEEAVLRESTEEVLVPWVSTKQVFKDPEYIGSVNINDWRYRGEIDGITTVFYEVEFIGMSEDIQAGDDLANVRWMTLNEINPEKDLEPGHICLYNMLDRHIQVLAQRKN